VPTVTFRLLYCFFIIEYRRRKILHFNVTLHPDGCVDDFFSLIHTQKCLDPATDSLFRGPWSQKGQSSSRFLSPARSFTSTARGFVIRACASSSENGAIRQLGNRATPFVCHKLDF
jgi:hypothetical protein